MFKKLIIMIGMIGLVGVANAAFDLGLLATPNVTNTVITKPNNLHTFQYTVTGVSTNVIVRAEGSLDNVSWFNLDDTNLNTTVTSNGTYKIHKSPFYSRFMRFRWVSKSPVVNGGTTPNINVLYDGIAYGGRE